MDVVTKEILKEIKNLDFGCEFIRGECVGMRKRVEKGFKDIGKICCRGCYHNVGYLRIKKESLPEEYLKYFSKPGGFLGDNGCLLPVDMRSRRCVIYTCRDSSISKEGREVLVNLERTT